MAVVTSELREALRSETNAEGGAVGSGHGRRLEGSKMAKDIKLTDVERQLLVNQYRIMQLLDPKRAHEYEDNIEILQSGYETFYGEIVRNFGSVSRDDGAFVLDVLAMYRAIEDYKAKHPDDDEIVAHPDATFRGFDGNAETTLVGFTRFVIEHQEKFAEQRAHKARTSSWNSNTAMRARYAEMRDRWRATGATYGLAREQVLAILARVRG